MRLKKKPKRILITLLVLIVLSIVGFISYKVFFNKDNVKEVKVLHEIKGYGYKLKDTKSAEYKKMFYELEKILKKDPVDEKEYAKKISEMFIYDFYSLNDKTAKTDVGGTDFVYSTVLDNFLKNAEDTYYKYVESNIYNQRKQKLPTVDKITIDSIDNTTFTYSDTADKEAYEVKISWTYTSDDFSDYQKEATLIFMHEGKKLSLVELK